jgi:signal transduction histidine kinase
MEEDFSFELTDADTGEKAIEILTGGKVDIILLDNKLPGMDGIEVLEYINKNRVDVAVMMITSYASLDLAVKATNNGAFNFVPKPFTPDELRASMENITKHLFLKRMTRQMDEAGKQVRFQFLSVLSHELKSPINAVEGYLNIMKDKQVGEDISDYETMIERSIERIKGMRNLIMDLLDLTKLESGKKIRKVKDTDILQVARLAMDTIEPLAIQRNVKIYLHAPEQLTYASDGDEMEIIFNNLISNAVKYNKEGGEVNISINDNGHGLSIKVEDTGIGMNTEEVESLFGEFVRIKNAKTRNITGSGLGLSIIKKIIEQNYSGSISAESEPDKGSSFTVILPKVQ